MTITRNDTAAQLRAIWEVLSMAREDCIPEDGNGPYDEQWQEVCEAMAWISEDLGIEADEMDDWDGEGSCPKCQGDWCDPEGGCVHDE